MQLSYKDIKTLKGDFGKEKKEALRFLIEYGEKLDADRLTEIYNIGPMFSENKYSNDQFANIIINQPTYNEKCVRKDFFSVVFLNSVIGAKTNQECIQVIQAVAKTNKMPYYGFLKDKQVSEEVLVKIHINLSDNFDFDILGFYLNKKIILEIPIIDGINTQMTFDKYKYLCSALNISQNIQKFHILNKTPSFNNDAFYEEHETLKTINFNEEDKNEIIDSLNTAIDHKVDLIILGSPYVSIDEVKNIIESLKNRKIHQDVKLLLKMSDFLYFTFEKFGFLKRLKQIGCDYLFDQKALEQMFKNQKLTNIATNSSFNAYIINEHYDKKTHYGSLKKCINAAMCGYWNG